MEVRGMADQTTDALRTQCWNSALEAFGTAFIFEQRAQSLRNRLRLLQFVGLAVPLLVGLIVLGFGTNTDYLPRVLLAAGVLGVVQGGYSLWALTQRWEDGLAYAQESASGNHRISREYKKLAQAFPGAGPERDLRLGILAAEDSQRTEQDYAQAITEPERRMGMRAALRQFQRQCAVCKSVPTSMTPTKCDVCGNF